jgi:hypothetical protein
MAIMRKLKSLPGGFTITIRPLPSYLQIGDVGVPNGLIAPLSYLPRRSIVRQRPALGTASAWFSGEARVGKIILAHTS